LFVTRRRDTIPAERIVFRLSGGAHRAAINQDVDHLDAPVELAYVLPGATRTPQSPGRRETRSCGGRRASSREAAHRSRESRRTRTRRRR
jgi:hypothetical protein